MVRRTHHILRDGGFALLIIGWAVLCSLRSEMLVVHAAHGVLEVAPDASHPVASTDGTTRITLRGDEARFGYVLRLLLLLLLTASPTAG